MNSKMLLLAALTDSGKTGYEIKKLCTEGEFSYFSEISYGSIYPTLTKLEQQGLVDCKLERQSGKPDRKVYTITPEGLEELRQCLPTLSAGDVYKSEFCLLILCGAMANQKIMSTAIEQRKQHFEEKKQAIAQSCECHPSEFVSWLSNYGEFIMQSHINYLREHGQELVELFDQHKEAAE